MPVERPQVIETTALGAAMLAGVGVGLFASLAAASAMARPDAVFRPATDAAQRAERRRRWGLAVRQVLGG